MPRSILPPYSPVVRALFTGFLPDGLWFTIVTLTLFRFALTADINVHLTYGPHDASLYITRAYYFLQGEGFGPYNSQTLLKLPGISLWIGWTRMLGVPFMLSLNLFYSLSGIYFIVGLRRIGFGTLSLSVAYGLYVLNPISLNYFFLNTFREPIDTCLLVTLLGSMVFLFDDLRKRRLPGPHLIIFSMALSFALLLREEGVLLYGLWMLLLLTALHQLWLRRRLATRRGRAYLFVVVAVPLLFVSVGNLSAKAFIYKHYGAAILHDFGQGEFPRFIAATRSVKSKTKQTYVWITQEALQNIKIAVPMVAPLVDHLPPPPTPLPWYLSQYTFTGQWPYSHITFWIKDAAFAAGLTPNLPAAQSYFRRAALEIERACEEGRLDCEPDGGGVFPRFRLSWIPIIIKEALAGIRDMVYLPLAVPRGIGPLTFSPVPLPTSRMVQLGNYYGFSTLTQFDSLEQWRSGVLAPEKMEILGLNALQQSALSRGFSPLQRFTGPFAYWRPVLGKLHYLNTSLILLAFGVLFVRLAQFQQYTWNPFYLVVIVFLLFIALRLAALSYVSVPMGSHPDRLYHGAYAVLAFLAPLVMGDGLREFLTRISRA